MTLHSALCATALTLLLTQSGCSRKPKPEGGTPREAAPQETVPVKNAAPSPAKPSSLDAPAPTLSPSVEGIEIIGGPELVARLAESDAKATLVNVWASWCGPCRREFPMLQKVGQELSKKGVALEFVTVDDDKSYEEALEFAKERDLAPPLLAAQRPLGPFKRALSPQWPGMLPATFLFDDTGKLRYFWPGEVFESELLPIVDGLLAGEDIDGYARVGLQRGIDTRN